NLAVSRSRSETAFVRPSARCSISFLKSWEFLLFTTSLNWGIVSAECSASAKTDFKSSRFSIIVALSSRESAAALSLEEPANGVLARTLRPSRLRFAWPAGFAFRVILLLGLVTVQERKRNKTYCADF